MSEEKKVQIEEFSETKDSGIFGNFFKNIFGGGKKTQRKKRNRKKKSHKKK